MVQAAAEYLKEEQVRLRNWGCKGREKINQIHLCDLKNLIHATMRKYTKDKAKPSIIPKTKNHIMQSKNASKVQGHFF